MCCFVRGAVYWFVRLEFVCFGFVCGTSFCTSRVAPCCRLGGVVCVAGTRFARMCVRVVSVDGTGVRA